MSKRVRIDFLKNHPACLKRCSEIWYEVLGKRWLPKSSPRQMQSRLRTHLQEDKLPLTMVALIDELPVGMCSLRLNDDDWPSKLQPWLGSLVVDRAYQGRGIGQKLITAVAKKARSLNFTKLYLLTFDPKLPDYYRRFGWLLIAMDAFKGHPISVMELQLPATKAVAKRARKRSQA